MSTETRDAKIKSLSTKHVGKQIDLDKCTNEELDELIVIAKNDEAWIGRSANQAIFLQNLAKVKSIDKPIGNFCTTPQNVFYNT